MLIKIPPKIKMSLFQSLNPPSRGKQSKWLARSTEPGWRDGAEVGWWRDSRRGRGCVPGSVPDPSHMVFHSPSQCTCLLTLRPLYRLCPLPGSLLIPPPPHPARDWILPPGPRHVWEVFSDAKAGLGALLRCCHTQLLLQTSRPEQSDLKQCHFSILSGRCTDPLSPTRQSSLSPSCSCSHMAAGAWRT